MIHVQSKLGDALQSSKAQSTQTHITTLHAHLDAHQA